jgi:hypothetical protein
MHMRAETIPVRVSAVGWRATALAAFLGLAIAGLAPGGALAQVERDPAKIVGPEECAECHEDETAVWRHTTHHKTFREMPRDREGIKMARKMGLRRIKQGSICLDCHFTTQKVDDKVEAIAGISCESCHGAGEDWVKLHSNFSGKEEETETAEEERIRWEKSEEAGMIRPNMLYRLAKNCYSCHLVPQEELVNKGGHTAGSDFELVAWSQGEIRHNVWYNDGEANPPADTDRRRKLFAVGLAVELETALRGVAKATQKADYAVSMAKRANRARKRMGQAAKLVSSVAELAEMAKVANAAKLSLSNGEQLRQAADRIADLTQEMVDGHKGAAFAALDPALPGPDGWKGTPKPAME